jgi:CAAX protease family protein
MTEFNEPAEYDRAGGAAGRTTEQRSPGATESTGAAADILPYVAPMFAYLGLTALEGYVPQLLGSPSPLWYPIAYGIKLILVALLAWHYRATWNDFRPAPSLGKIALGVLTGLLVCAAWVGLDGLYPAIKFLGSRSAFDPLTLDAASRWAFIAERLLGLVVLVPVIEEVFWRSFLMRWIIDNDFLKVPVGKVTSLAAAVTSTLFALAHPEWLPALLTGALWAWLLWATRSLSTCLISHAMANLALGIYVITTHNWKFW